MSEQSVGKRRRTAAELEQIVREFESSGLNRSQFCRQQGLTWEVLNRHLRRQQAGGSGASRKALIAVELAGNHLGMELAGSCGLTVMLGKGRRIAVNSGFDTVTLQRLVQVLETM
jgi:hypothetical protein